jgi:hypothetical protein
MLPIIIFIVINLVLFFSMFYLSYQINVYTRKKNNKPPFNVMEFVNKGRIPPLKDIMVGLVFGLIFGFLDNFGLWMGLDVLHKYLPGGLLTKSALGNTYSDLLGVTMGSFISIMAKDIFDFDEDNSPIWLNTLGIVSGCLLGLTTGRLLTGKT